MQVYGGVCASMQKYTEIYRVYKLVDQMVRRALYLYKPKGEHGICVPIPVQTQRRTWGLCSHTCTNPKGNMGSVFPYLYEPKGEHGVCVPIPVQTQRGKWGLCSHTCTNPKGSMGSVFPYLYKPKGEHGVCVPIPVQTQRGTWGLCSHKMMCTTWPSNRLSWRGRCSCS